MSDMTTREAVNIAKQMKNHYGAFARIEEVLVEVAAAKNVVGELTKQRDVLAGEVAGLKQEATRASARVKKKLADEETTEQGMSKRATDIQTRLDGETSEAKKASQETIVALKVKYSSEEGKLKASIEALGAIEKDIKERIDKLEKIYAGTRAKVDKL